MARALRKLLKIVEHYENWPMRLLEQIGLVPSRPIALRLRSGPTFYVRPRSSDVSSLQSVTREQEYFRYWSVMPGDTVVDIGANIGAFAVFVAYREPTARVVAVEPLRSNVELLQRNISANRLQNVTAVRAAVSDTSGRLRIYHGKGTWCASGSLYPIDAVRSDRAEEVDGMTLEDLFRAHGVDRCDFLKMDCEGAEYRILFSLPDALWPRVSKIALEFHNFEPGKTQFDLERLLQTKGYRTALPKKFERKEIGLLYAMRSV